MYLLKRIEDGRYVAQSGSSSSYTKDIVKAQRYYTKEQALADACGNEVVVDLDDLLT